jgi:DNA-binding CsgD family transcriptional regulator
MTYAASLTINTILQSIGLDARNRVHSTGLPSRVDPVTTLTPDAFERSDLAQLIDEMSLGVVLVSSSGQVCQSSRAARDSMLSSNLLRVQADQLQATSAADHKALLYVFCRARNGLRSLLELSSNGASLLVSVVPLAKQFASSGATIGVFFQRCAIGDEQVFLLFARKFNLTSRERQVLTFVCRGLSESEIADELNIAVSTVSSYVLSLCFKTASQGTPELINRVAMLAPAEYLTGLEMN